MDGGRILIEVCCGGVDDVVGACAGGADRVELNSGMFLGGLTPSAGTILECKGRVDVPVMVMVRPRAGGFCYSDAEMRVMVRDVRLAVEHGADGVVFGVLDGEGRIDMERCAELVAAADGREAV
ncbi:MAG: copper homeostasis protein CutC, partial [Anaerohalosphaera sp.]|nr:copper homeostasis protein CutC [Anaerohalosphaera sp.]